MQANKEQYPACNKVISHLTAVSEELVDVPLYFSLHDVCKTVKCTPPKADVLRSALINAGELSASVQSALAMFQKQPSASYYVCQEARISFASSFESCSKGSVHSSLLSNCRSCTYAVGCA